MSLLLILLFCFNSAVCLPQQPTSRARSAERSSLTGVYRIDIRASDKLYSVVAGASSKVPFSEQQRFFIDLAVRLTPPDLLAIEQRGTRISLGSSRAPRMEFVADGVAHNTRARDGHLVRARFAVEQTGVNQRLVFTSTGKTEDNFSVVFESHDNGKRLRVVGQLPPKRSTTLVIQPSTTRFGCRALGTLRRNPGSNIRREFASRFTYCIRISNGLSFHFPNSICYGDSSPRSGFVWS